MATAEEIIKAFPKCEGPLEVRRMAGHWFVWNKSGRSYIMMGRFRSEVDAFAYRRLLEYRRAVDGQSQKGSERRWYERLFSTYKGG